MKTILIAVMLAATCGAQTLPSDALKGVTSCEKRGWPIRDPFCHGYALAMAHQHFQEHRDFYNPPKEPLIVLSSSGGSAIASNITYPESPTTLPLVCGKYQHVENKEGFCHNACTDVHGNSCIAIVVCDSPIDRCVDDMHAVTEREWQELMDRLRALEAQIKAAP